MIPTLVLAYIGPGLSGGVLAVVLGFILSIFLALFAVLWYPIKKLFKKKTPATPPEDAPTAPAGTEPPQSAPEPPASDA